MVNLCEAGSWFPHFPAPDLPASGVPGTGTLSTLGDRQRTDDNGPMTLKDTPPCFG